MKSFFLVYVKFSAIISTLFFIKHLYVYEGDMSDLASYSLFPALTLSTVISFVHLIIARSAGVTKNFSPYQTQVLQVENLSMETLNNKIISNTNWKVVRITSDTLEYKNTIFSMRSFGERIKINKSQTSISIKSYPIVRTTLLDYGVNYQNVKKVERLLSYNQPIQLTKSCYL